MVEGEEKQHPDTDKEHQNQQKDTPGGNCLIGPQIDPITPIWSRQPIVLKHYDKEEPLQHIVSYWDTLLARKEVGVQ